MFPPPTFFPSESLNITEIMLRNRRDDDIAIHFAREGVSNIENVTWKEFRERIRRIRSALTNSGVVEGDIIAAVISNSVDAMAICLAALSIGAVWSSSSCDLGTAGIVDRYKQISPKVIFADDGYVYAGKTINLEERIVDWSHQLGRATSKLIDVVVIPYCNLRPDLSKIHLGCSLQTFLDRDSDQELRFDFVPFSHPAFILYSSGTVSLPIAANSPHDLAQKFRTYLTCIEQTGRPKCIVHSTGVSVISHLSCTLETHHVDCRELL